MAKERVMTSDKQPATAVITAGLLIGFVVVSRAIGYVATHTALLPDAMGGNPWVVSLAAVN
jgi:hypothetical protein